MEITWIYMDIYYIHNRFFHLSDLSMSFFHLFLSVLSPRTDPRPAAKASAAFSLEPGRSGHLINGIYMEK